MRLSAFALGLVLSMSWQGFASDVMESGEGKPISKTYTSYQVISALPPELWSIVSGYLDEGSKINFVTAICEKDVKLSGHSVNNLLAIKSHYTIENAEDLEDFETSPRPGMMSLNLACRIRDDDSFVKTVNVIASNNVISLNLSWNTIRPERAKSLTDALASNRTLHTLDLSGCFIDSGWTEYLRDALDRNETLTHLHLSDNSMGDTGAQYLAQWLLKNKKLEFLLVENNSIGDDGAASLARAAEKHEKLMYLNLSNNAISPARALSLAEIFRTKKNLRWLNLMHNDVGDEGCAALRDLQSTHPHSKILFRLR